MLLSTQNDSFTGAIYFELFVLFSIPLTPNIKHHHTFPPETDTGPVHLARVLVR